MNVPVNVPIAIRSDAPTPIYLQIKYQLRYLITSGKLPEGAQLPTVRATADRLGVNPGPVAQAYRELQDQGLLEASPGRGTFVAATLDTHGDAMVRQRLLADVVGRAAQRGRALGFRADDIRQHLDTLLGTTRRTVPVIFAAPSMMIARKYAASLERRVGDELTVHAVTIDEIAGAAPHVAALLDTAYFVVTFSGMAQRVEHDLGSYTRPSRVLGCTTEAQEHSLRALSRVGAGTSLCLVTQETYLPPTLTIIEQQTGRRAADVAICLDGDAATARELFPRVDRVVYTFVAREFLIEMGVPPEKRLEIAFDLTETSVTRLRDVLLPAEDGAGATVVLGAVADAG